MAFVKKTWKDRVAEYINRRVLTKEDGTTELVTVERSEGTISQEGDAFSAANMNDLEQRIANEFSEQNKNLTASDDTKFRFATDGEGNYGYLKADDSFVPFSGNLIVEKKLIQHFYIGPVPKTFTIQFENEFKKVPHVELLSFYAVSGYEQVWHNGVAASKARVTNVTKTSFTFTVDKWTNYDGDYNLAYVVVGV